jgi:hypothetical protein
MVEHGLSKTPVPSKRKKYPGSELHLGAIKRVSRP